VIALTKPLYSTAATASGGRTGRVRSADGALDLTLAVPAAMGGAAQGEAQPNPETLFAAGYAACFHSALGVVGRRAKVDTSGSSVTADVTIGVIPGGAYGLAVELAVEIPGVEKSVAQELAEAAHAVCPYSNATRGNIDVSLRVA